MSLSFGKINKRLTCVSPNETSVCHESVVKMNINSLNQAIQDELGKDSAEVTSRIERNCNGFISSISNIDNSGRFLDEAIFFIAELDKINESYANNFTDQIVSTVIPYADGKNLNRIDYALKENTYGELTGEQHEKIKKAISENLVADRILENHQKISKRFNIENEIQQIRSKGLVRTIESVCDIINTYNIEPYQKLNICIEEMTYILDKNGITYDKAGLVREAVEDIIITNELDLHNLKGYKKALKSSYCLDECDLSDVGIIVNPDIERKESIAGYIDAYLVNPDKSFASLIALCMRIARTCSVLDIKNNFDEVIHLIRKCCVFGVVDVAGATSCIKSFTDALSERDDIDAAYLDEMIKTIHCVTTNKIFCSPYQVQGDQENSDAVKNCCNNYMVPALQSTKNLLYDKANLEAVQFFGKNAPTVLPLNEFKIFKFNNLIKAAFNLDKYLKIKGRQLLAKPKEKVKKFIVKARNVLFGESADEIFNHLGAILTENNIPDICVALYEYNDDSEADLKEFLSEVCKSYNDTLLIENNNDIKVYYIMNPGVAEVHIRENVQLNLTEEDHVEKETSFEENYYMNLFSNTVEIMDEAATNHLTDIESFIVEFCSNPKMTTEHYEVALEALAILGATEADFKTFKTTYQYTLRKYMNESTAIEEVNDIGYNPINQNFVTELDKLEAFNTLAALLEAPELHKPKVGPAANYWDDDDDEDDYDEEESPKKSSNDKKETPKEEEKSASDKELEANKSKKKFGVDLNGLKLAMMGLKKKIGDLGHKEQEMSKNLDNNVAHLVKGMKDAMISDRREAIIKGSVIPSFSKCLKIAIGLAGIAAIPGVGPGAAIIAAIGGFAVSKHLTQKERVLLLDDIEVELDVLEKEISLAESRNQMNKYRALMKYKKDLQRQYQRIKYNVRVGKDILPDSTMGLKQYD